MKIRVLSDNRFFIISGVKKIETKGWINIITDIGSEIPLNPNKTILYEKCDEDKSFSEIEFFDRFISSIKCPNADCRSDSYTKIGPIKFTNKYLYQNMKCEKCGLEYEAQFGFIKSMEARKKE